MSEKKKQTPEELHAEGVQDTLEKLKSTGELIVEVGMDSFREILINLFDLRWQNRQLQKRGGELLEGDRASRRYAKTLVGIHATTTLPAVAERIERNHPELFDPMAGSAFPPKVEDDG